jgi:hypothetical protein
MPDNSAYLGSGMVTGECRTHAEINLMVATWLSETGQLDNYLATWKTDLKSS